ncbi:MipA/OmpV family protein [Xylophilus rhododendri]|nr:MipA/OmpV family protein [Xylophilus rhododendri]
MPHHRSASARLCLRRPALLLGAAALLAASAQAQEVPSAAPSWGVGGGVFYVRKPYKGYDSDTKVLPWVSYESEHFSIQVPQIDYKFSPVGPVSFRLRARYALNDGYDASDSPNLAGMADRDASVWLGAAAVWKNDFANVSAELLGATGQSKGSKFTIGLDRNFGFGSFVLTPRIAAVYADRKYVDYYYGVRAAEATASRAAYDGRSTTNLELGLRLGYGIDARQSLFLDVSGTRLGSAIKDSPLVDRSSVGGVRVGYLYRF